MWNEVCYLRLVKLCLRRTVVCRIMRPHNRIIPRFLIGEFHSCSQRSSTGAEMNVENAPP